MEESLVQILTPKVRIDVLHGVKKAVDRGTPYVVTFCGVNGVGKSTNLAKVFAFGVVKVLCVFIFFCFVYMEYYYYLFTCMFIYQLINLFTNTLGITAFGSNH